MLIVYLLVRELYDSNLNRKASHTRVHNIQNRESDANSTKKVINVLKKDFVPECQKIIVGEILDI